MLLAATSRYRSLLLLGALPFAMPLSASLVVAALAVVVFVIVAEPVSRTVPEKRQTEDRTEALTSADESEVLAAIDQIKARGLAVPSLVLYHPSPAVVRRALSAMDHDRDLGRVLPQLLAHRDPSVRAMALAHAS